MPSDDSPEGPAPRDRREAVREKAQLVHARQSRVRKLRIGAIALGSLLVVGALAGGVYWAFSSSASRPLLEPVSASGDGFPVTKVTGADANGVAGGVDGATPSADQPQAVPTPTATAAPTVSVDIYVDYLSPGAKEFQLTNASQLSTWVAQKSVNLTYYPVAMLTAKSNGTKYSLRAASAAACVATYAPDAFFVFNNALLKQQPDPDAAGPSDDELAVLARVSGSSAANTVDSCIKDEKYIAWVKDATDRALKAIPGTKGVALTTSPMVLVNGVPYVGQLSDPKEFQQFVMTVASDAYFGTPSPTPMRSASPKP